MKIARVAFHPRSKDTGLSSSRPPSGKSPLCSHRDRVDIHTKGRNHNYTFSFLAIAIAGEDFFSD